MRRQTGWSAHCLALRREQGTFGLAGTNGLYYLRARYYDPMIGRFLTRDPLPGSVRDSQSMNAYPYVQNNPVNRVDPSGMLSEDNSSGDLLSELLTPKCIAAGLFALVAVGFLIAALTYPPAIIAATESLMFTNIHLFLLASLFSSAFSVYNVDQCFDLGIT